MIKSDTSLKQEPVKIDSDVNICITSNNKITNYDLDMEIFTRIFSKSCSYDSPNSIKSLVCHLDHEHQPLNSIHCFSDSKNALKIEIKKLIWSLFGVDNTEIGKNL